MEKKIANVNIKCLQGDIANQAGCDAIVNAANAQLETGGGVAGAIHRAAGTGLAREARQQAPIRPGDAVITGGHDLPNQYVIHCLGPVYGRDKPEDELLAKCYTGALRLAEEKKIKSIAFPAISTGAFGYPAEEAAKVAFKTVIKTAPGLKYVKEIFFVLFSTKDLQLHDRILKEITGNGE